MANKTYLDFYYKFMKTGKMTNYYEPKEIFYGGGLCNALPYTLLMEEPFELIYPTPGDKPVSVAFWADGVDKHDYNKRRFEFTPLRQTLLLLCAAMSDEL